MENSHIVVNGQFVSAKIERVVLAIKEYEPLIDVQWIPPAAREQGVAAFKLVYNDPSGHPFTLFHVNSEDEFDLRVLQRIIVNDQRNNPLKISDLEAWEEAQKRIAHQEYLDKVEEAQDIAAHVFRTHKSRYRVSKDLLIDDAIPFNIARGIPN